MNPYIPYTCWGALLVGGALWAAVLLCRRKYRETRFGVHTLGAAIAAALVSLFTYANFTLVFIVKRSSNVAQLAQPDGMNWWSYWFNFWPFALFSNFALLVGGAILVFLPPYPPKYWQSTACRLVVCVGIGFSLYYAIAAAPDA